MESGGHGKIPVPYLMLYTPIVNMYSTACILNWFIPSRASGTLIRLLEELLLLIFVLSFFHLTEKPFPVRNVFPFRMSILSRIRADMNGELRKGWKIPPFPFFVFATPLGDAF